MEARPLFALVLVPLLVLECLELALAVVVVADFLAFDRDLDVDDFFDRKG